MRRLISRLVLFLAALGMLTFAANSTLTPHRTADTWPNPLSVTNNPLPAPVIDGDLQTVSDTMVEGV